MAAVELPPPTPPAPRHVAVVGCRAHVQLRRAWPEQADGYRRELLAALGALPGASWVDPRLVESHAVVAFDGPVPGTESLLRAVEEAEERAGVADNPFPQVRGDHPADPDPITRSVAEIVADSLAFGVGATLRVLQVPRLPIELDLEALATVVQNVPRLRRGVERLVGVGRAEVGLAAIGSLTQGLAQNLVGPVAGATYHSLRLDELRARRSAWHRAEPLVYARPRSPVRADVARLLQERPCPLPDGPIERYSETAWLASLGGFVASIPLTGTFEGAFAALTSGVPKAARLGREAFASRVGSALARRDVVVLRPGVLRLLDRVDTLVVDGSLLGDEIGARLVAAAVGDDLAVVAAGRMAAGAPEVERSVRRRDLPATVRLLQEQGHVVLGIGTHRLPEIVLADCALGFVDAGGRAPEGAHLLSSNGVGDALALVQACRAARRASTESARLALVGAAGAGILSFVPLVPAFLPGPVPRAMTAVDSASLAAILNGMRLAAGVLGPTPSVTREEPVTTEAGNDEKLGAPVVAGAVVLPLRRS